MENVKSKKCKWCGNRIHARAGQNIEDYRKNICIECFKELCLLRSYHGSKEFRTIIEANDLTIEEVFSTYSDYMELEKEKHKIIFKIKQYACQT